MFKGLAAGVGILLTVGILKAGFSFLKGVNLEALNPTLRQAIQGADADLQTITGNRQRLDRAESLLGENDKISIDQAAMLICATLEGGLKTLALQNNIQISLGESQGMVDLAIQLKDRRVISVDDLGKIKTLVYNVRNPVMHGNFEEYPVSDVRQQLDFARGFFQSYRLI